MTSRRTLTTLGFENTDAIVAKFLAQGTDFMEADKDPETTDIEYLLQTRKEFAFITDKFFLQTRIRMHYTTSSGERVQWRCRAEKI